MGRNHLVLGLIAAAAMLAIVGRPAASTPLSPNDGSLTLLGSLPGGDLVVDTGSNGDAASLPVLTFGDNTVVGNVVAQSGGPEIAVFLFDGNSDLADGSTLKVTSGGRPLALLFRGSARIEGTIDVSGAAGGTGGYAVPAGSGGMGIGGGGNGGTGGPFTSAQDGGGSGGGGAGGNGTVNYGLPGGGGGFGTPGGNAGAQSNGGLAYGDPLDVDLRGGSGGGGGGGGCCVGFSVYQTGGGGGAGGGGLEIGALNDLVLAGATILANGGDGGDGHRDGGGGSGGGILLHAFDVTIDAASLLQADGGIGGIGVNMGGCGGAGRIEAVTNTEGSLVADGTIEAQGAGTCAATAFETTSLDGIGEPMSGTPAASVPEPPPLTLLIFGLAGLGAVRRRRMI